jgi:hypothetical protein
MSPLKSSYATARAWLLQLKRERVVASNIERLPQVGFDGILVAVDEGHLDDNLYLCSKGYSVLEVCFPVIQSLGHLEK